VVHVEILGRIKWELRAKHVLGWIWKKWEVDLVGIVAQVAGEHMKGVVCN
jgi:hypothetical protein